jgi:hypothetical protein
VHPCEFCTLIGGLQATPDRTERRIVPAVVCIAYSYEGMRRASRDESLFGVATVVLQYRG